MKSDRFVIVHEVSQLSEILEYRRANLDTQIVCFDFWIERELKKKDIPCISLQDLMPSEDTEEGWWLLVQNVAREWYRLPAMKFFEYEDIRIGEALEPMMEAYLSKLLHYVRIGIVFKKRYPGAKIYIPAPLVGDMSSAGPLSFFEQWAVVDAFRMVRVESEIWGHRTTPRKHVFTRTFFKSFLIRAYNVVNGLAPPRSFKIFASEYWSHIAPVIEQMDEAELVLMESSELKKIPWRQILKHRIRIQHPADRTNWFMRRSAKVSAEEFLKKWKSVKKEVAGYLSETRGEIDWTPVLEACEYLVTYSARVITDIDALRKIMKEEKPGVVLQRASIGGRQHHFFLMARLASQLGIKSIELQHAGAIFDPRSIHSHLETSFLAAYGEIEKEGYSLNGYASERIISVGSPRFDQYRQNDERFSEKKIETLKSLGFSHLRKVLMVAVPAEQISLSPLSFSSYDIGAFFLEMRHVRLVLPEAQFIFKFRQIYGTEGCQAYLQELFPEGGIAMVDGDPYPLICASDVVVSGNSTIMYEAMISRKPLVLSPWKTWDYNLALYGAVASYVRSGADLAGVLEGIFSGNSHTQDVVNKQQLFMGRHAFDGHSAERIVALLRRSDF